MGDEEVAQPAPSQENRTLRCDCNQSKSAKKGRYRRLIDSINPHSQFENEFPTPPRFLCIQLPPTVPQLSLKTRFSLRRF